MQAWLINRAIYPRMVDLRQDGPVAIPIVRINKERIDIFREVVDNTAYRIGGLMGDRIQNKGIRIVVPVNHVFRYTGVGAGVPDKHEPSVARPYGRIAHFSRIGDFRSAEEGAVVGGLFAASPKDDEANQRGQDIAIIIFHCRCFKSLLSYNAGYLD